MVGGSLLLLYWFIIRNIITKLSLIKFTYAKTLVVDLNVLKNETEICVLDKACLSIFTLSDR